MKPHARAEALRPVALEPLSSDHAEGHQKNAANPAVDHRSRRLRGDGAEAAYTHTYQTQCRMYPRSLSLKRGATICCWSYTAEGTAPMTAIRSLSPLSNRITGNIITGKLKRWCRSSYHTQPECALQRCIGRKMEVPISDHFAITIKPPPTGTGPHCRRC
jgi:hypothetical protein